MGRGRCQGAVPSVCWGQLKNSLEKVNPVALLLLLDILTEVPMVPISKSLRPPPAAASLRGSLASGGTADGFFREASACGGSEELRAVPSKGSALRFDAEYLGLVIRGFSRSACDESGGFLRGASSIVFATVFGLRGFCL